MKIFKTLIFFVFLGWCIPALAAGPMRLSYSCFFPLTHVQSRLAEAWCREVEARSGGELIINYYPAGTLTKAKDVYDGVTQRISDIGLSALGYTRGRFPLMSGLDLPLGYTSGRQATEVANAAYFEFLPQELSGVKVLYFHAHGPGMLHTAGKAVRSMEDMQGMKIRATGNSAAMVSALRGSPVAMSMGESYQAMQKGVVDGGFHPLETNKGWKVGEVVDYLTKTSAAAYTTVFFVVMNKDVWASLSPAAQRAVTEVSKEWISRHGEAWDQSDREGLEFFLAQPGNAVITLDKNETERWEQAMEPLFTKYEQECAQKNVDGQALLRFVRKALAQ